MIEILLALGAGLILGTFTGLVPGIHINLVAAFVASSLYFLSSFPPLAIVVFIISLAITHTFLDFIPSIYLGAPQEDTFLSILPGHELLMEGKGHEAVVLALYGCVGALIIGLLAFPFYAYIVPLLNTKIVPYMAFILLAISLYTIIRERNSYAAATVFILAGFLGKATFSLPIKEPLLPLLTGLFGASALIISLREKTIVRPQIITRLKEITPSKKDTRNALIGAALVAPPCSFLPAIGSGYASFISSEIMTQSRKGFLMLNGAINVVVMVASFILVYTLGKARTGSAAALKKIIETPHTSEIAIGMVAMIVAGLSAFIRGVIVSKWCASNISKVNYQKLSLVVLIFVTAVVIFFSRWEGFMVLVTATSLGIFAIKSNVKRIHLMGALLVPTMIYYLL